MFEKLTNKQKFLALVAAIVITLIFAYKRSYSNVFSNYSSLKASKQKLEIVKNSESRIFQLKKDVTILDNIIGKHATNPDIVQQEILNKFSALKTTSELVKLKAVHKAKNNYFKVHTNQLIVNGDYNNAIRTCYEFEKDFDYSRIVSLSIYTEKDPRTKRKKLFEQIIFQNYEKNN